LKAKKHLGQHFLTDRQVIDKIIETIQFNCPKHEAILEVGPGQGVLSFELEKFYENYKAVELDVDMIDILKNKINQEKLLHIDFLKTNLFEIFDNKSFNLVGNFPYNISSQIIFKMIENKNLIPLMIGMFQKEVAERICSTQGGKKNGILSLNAQAFYDAEVLFHIGPEAFDPPPKVNSSVIILRRRDKKQLGCDEKMYRKILKAAFQQRRKKMRNTLKTFNLDFEDPIFQKRPEELGVEDFVYIVNSIKPD
jgi:16S rRNA (adenine1518-N6/adenine1519-N6)-dimethyltransferase